jgi:phospholipid/cholesterol/gamma-HCH transport system ATP-binding protein
MEVIQVQNFKKMFGKKEVHKDVSFSVRKGECLALLGGSGAGKSVILRSLIGLERPDAGNIFIEGEDITRIKENALTPIRKKVAYVFQNGALFDSMSVYDNLAYPLQEHTQLSPMEIKDKVDALLNEFNLAGNENLLPNELSGGMQKRVGLARAIILQPKVILYDEPTAGLDPANTIVIQDLIIKLKGKGVTSILVTHDMETALRVCDRACFLENGEITDLGDLDELRKHKDRILEFFIRGYHD